MDYMTAFWALFALAVCVVGFLVYREESRPRQGVSYLSYQLYKRQRQAQYELTFWKLVAASITVAGVAFVLACLITL